MSLTSAPLVLVSSAPESALSALGDSESDVSVHVSVPTGVRPGARVLLSGVLPPAEVSALFSSMQGAAAVAAVDLTAVPDLNLLEQAGATVLRWEKWGELPVAVLGTGEGVAVADVDLAALAAILPAGTPALLDRVRLSQSQVAQRSTALRDTRARLQLNRARTERVRDRLNRAKGTVKVRTKERDRARRRLGALESSRELRWGRSATRLVQRVGGKRALLMAAAAGAAALALVVVLTLLWPTVGLAIAAALALATVAGAAAGHLALAVRAARRPAPQQAPRPRAQALSGPVAETSPTTDSDAVLTELNRVQIELADVRNSLASLNEMVRREPTRRTVELAAARGQLQATTQLFTLFTPEAPVPAMGGWAASPDLVLVIVDELRRINPPLVVECGSGVSTLWMALAIRKYGLDTKIVSLDHDAHYGAQTTALLARHGVSDIAQVRHAPLTDVGLPGHATRWYDPSGWSDLRDIGMLVVDGPPAATGPGVRYPAVPLLRAGFAPTVSVVLDDMIRADEQHVAAQWQEQLGDVARVDLPLEKHATILRRG